MEPVHQAAHRTLIVREDHPSGRGIGAIAVTADLPSRNGTVFPRRVLDRAMREHVMPSRGYDAHPELPQRGGKMKDAMVVWDSWEWRTLDGLEHVWLHGRLMSGEAGDKTLEAIEMGAPPGVSARGGGDGIIRPNGERVYSRLVIRAFDVVEYAANQYSQIGVHEHLKFTESTEADVDFLEDAGTEGTQEQANTPAPPTSPEPIDMSELRQGIVADLTPVVQEAATTAVGAALEESKQSDPEDAIAENERKLAEAQLTLTINNRRDKVRELLEGLKPVAEKYSPKYRSAFLKNCAESCETAFAADTETDINKLFESVVMPIRQQYSEFTSEDVRQRYIGEDGDREKPLEITDVKSVFESDMGMPGYMEPAYLIWQSAVRDKVIGETSLVQESLADFDWGDIRKNKDKYHNGVALFDILDGVAEGQFYKDRLISEYQSFTHHGGLDGIFMEQTSDNAPSASATQVSLVMRLLPTLVGSSRFTVIPVARRKGEFPVEVYTPPGQVDGTNIDIAGAISAGTTYDTTHKHLVPGSVGIYKAAAKQDDIEGDSFIVDYSNGIIHIPSALAALTGRNIRYKYYNLSPGENVTPQEIVTGSKMEPFQLGFMRAKVYITEEAEANQGGLNWSLRDRSLFNASRRLEEQIDEEMHMRSMMHMAQAPTTKATGAAPSVDKYLTTIAQAKSAIERKRLQARLLIGHNETMAGWTTNDAFTREGLPSYMMTPSNMLGRVAGLDVVASPYWTNETDFGIQNPKTVYLLINRNRPLRIKGPEFGRDAEGDALDAEEFIMSIDYQITGGYHLDDTARVKGRAA